MPAGLLAALPIIFAGAGAASGLGFGLHSLLNQPSTPNPNAPPTPTQQNQAVAQLQQNRELASQQVAQSLPGLQESTSGGVSPAYLGNFGAVSTGNANLLGTNQLGDVVNQFLGLPSGTSGAGSTNSAGAVSGLALGGGSANPAVSAASSSFLGGGQPGLASPFDAAVYGAY